MCKRGMHAHGAFTRGAGTRGACTLGAAWGDGRGVVGVGCQAQGGGHRVAGAGWRAWDGKRGLADTLYIASCIITLFGVYALIIV